MDDGKFDSKKNAPSSGELFVGLNILSKIGVIFIIAGFIAFTAVACDMPGILRAGMLFALGSVMAGAGELFYRKGSAVFARTLTLGAIVEWAIAIPVSRFSFHAINVVFAIATAVVFSTASLLLAKRYRSRALLTAALICAFIPFFAVVDSISGYFAGMAYIIAVQTAVVIMSTKLDKAVFVPIVGICCNIAASFASLLCSENIFYMDTPCVIAAAIYMAVSFGMYSAFSAVRCYKDGGKLGKYGVPLIVAQSAALSLSILFSLCFSERPICGIIMVSYCVLYLVATVYLAKSPKRKTGLAVCAENLLLAALTAALFSFVIGRFAYMAYHIFAAALYIWGIWKNDRAFKIRGLITLGLSESYFVLVCGLNFLNPVFLWQFTLNAILWIGIMTILAVKGNRGKWLSSLSCFSLVKAAIWGVYLIIKFTVRNVGFNGLIGAALTAAVFMLTGFTAGKLKFMGKAAPISSICFYSFGLLCLFNANILNGGINANATVIAIITVIAVNIASVLSVLDMALRIKSLVPRFARAVGLVTSAFALYTITTVLDGNGWVAFASCIISVIYLAAATVWIMVGFVKNNTLLRRFGLALSLLASAKLFLFDFSGIGTSGRMLMCIGFGITLLCISFAYGYFSKKLKERS